MNIERISLPSRVLELWKFFNDGLLCLEVASREVLDAVQLQKQICTLAANPVGGYVAIVKRDDGVPVSFAVAQENTFLFAKDRSFEVRAVHYVDGYAPCVLSLMADFETWCRENRIAKYSVSTRRNTGATIRCFRHARYGFGKPYLVFEKTIT